MLASTWLALSHLRCLQCSLEVVPIAPELLNCALLPLHQFLLLLQGGYLGLQVCLQLPQLQLLDRRTAGLGQSLHSITRS
jgi:hypothetical protein